MLTNWKTISNSIKRLRRGGTAVEENVGLTKKELLNLTRERDKLERALGGIKEMGGLPDVLFVIDTNKEHIAVAEAKNLGIPVVAVVDPNSDPDMASPSRSRQRRRHAGHQPLLRPGVRARCSTVCSRSWWPPAWTSARPRSRRPWRRRWEAAEAAAEAGRRGRRPRRPRAEKPAEEAEAASGGQGRSGQEATEPRKGRGADEAQTRPQRRRQSGRPKPESRAPKGARAEEGTALAPDRQRNERKEDNRWPRSRPRWSRNCAKTGAGMMDCKKALSETDGDMEEAVDWLRKKGLAAAAKKAGRVAAEGLIGVVTVDGPRGAGRGQRGDRLRRPQREVPGLRPRAAPAGAGGRRRYEALKAMAYPEAGRNVEEELTQLIATIGENMNLRRARRLSVDQRRRRLLRAQPDRRRASARSACWWRWSPGRTPQRWPALGKQIAMHVAAAAPQAVDRRRRRSRRPGARARGAGRAGAGLRQAGRDHREDGRGPPAQVLRRGLLLEQTFVIDGETKVRR